MGFFKRISTKKRRSPSPKRSPKRSPQRNSPSSQRRKYQEEKQMKERQKQNFYNFYNQKYNLSGMGLHTKDLLNYPDIQVYINPQNKNWVVYNPKIRRTENVMGFDYLAKGEVFKPERGMIYLQPI